MLAAADSTRQRSSLAALIPPESKVILFGPIILLNNSIIDNWHSHEKNKLSKQNNILQLLKQNYVLENDQYVTIINLNSSKVYNEKNTTRSKVTL